MSKVLVTEYSLESIADAIRAKNGTQNTYKPGQMAAAIATIPNVYDAGDEGKVVSNGALVQQTSRSVTENGTFDTTLNNEVTVNIPGTGTLETLTVTQNGTYTPGAGVAGFSQVDVNVSSSNLALNFDFTQSMTDTIIGYTPDCSNITQDSSGAKFSTNYGQIKLGRRRYSANTYTYEIDVDMLNLDVANHKRFLMVTTSYGFIYRSSGVWAFYTPSGWTESGKTSKTEFNGCTVKVYVDASGYWHIYKNGTLWWEPSYPISLDTNTTDDFRIRIGTITNQSIGIGSIITGFRVY